MTFRIIKTAFLCPVFFTVLVFFALISPACACECSEQTEERGLEIIDKAALIIAGRIVALETREQPEEDFDYTQAIPIPLNPLYARARIRILDIYKGETGDEKIEAYIDVMTSCGYLLQIGDVTSFVLNRNEDLLVAAGICDQPTEAHWRDLEEGKFRTASPP